MPRTLRATLLLVLAACAGGETESADASFGGSNGPPVGSQPSAPPATSATEALTTSGATEGLTRPTETTFPVTDADADASDPGDTTSVVDPGSTSSDPSTTAPVDNCGNNNVEPPEECDMFKLGDMTCQKLGFTGGLLKCNPDCTFDKTMCTSQSCGDGIVQMGEECDCGNVGSPCTAAQLGNAACTTLNSPKGSPYAGGSLACNSPNSCSFNKAACTYCGDGVRNGAEACEGGDLGGQTCQGLGFNGGGTLTCTADCAYNTGGCQNIQCGNGQCQPGEDSCSCPSDCPDDPGSCSPCECGGFSQICACDVLCPQFGDCCPNGPC